MEMDISVQAFEWLLIEWGETEKAPADPGFGLESGKSSRVVNKSTPVLEAAGASGIQEG